MQAKLYCSQIQSIYFKHSFQVHSSIETHMTIEYKKYLRLSIKIEGKELTFRSLDFYLFITKLFY